MSWKKGFGGLTVPWNKLILPYTILKKTTFQVEKPYGLVSNKSIWRNYRVFSERAGGIADFNCSVSHTYLCLYHCACVHVCMYNIFLSVCILLLI